MRFGHIKVLAHRWLRGEPIPIFKSRTVNRAIDAHAERIQKARTHKRNRPLDKRF